MCYKFYTGPSKQDTWNLYALHLHTLNIYLVFCELFEDQISFSKVALDGVHLNTSCDFVVLTWKASCSYMVGSLFFDVSSYWFGPLATWFIWHAVAFDVSIFFASCLTLLAENFCNSTLHSFMVLETKSYISMQDTCSFWWVFTRDTCACTALYNLSTDLYPCLKLVSRSNLAMPSFACGLQKSSYLAYIVSKQRSPAGKHQETYWSIPKSLLHTMTFLHFSDLHNMASS